MPIEPKVLSIVRGRPFGNHIQGANLDTTFAANLTRSYASASQVARVLTEDWVHRTSYCPNCGQGKLNRFSNNQPAADFYCANCGEQYELKSTQGGFGKKVNDGAYDKLVERLSSSNNPNFFLLNYDQSKLQVQDFCVVPKHFFVPEIVEKRKPLAPTARRAGWVGCNILLHRVPEAGKIYLVLHGIVTPKEEVLGLWRKTLFLRGAKATSAKGWLLDVMRCIDTIGSQEFSLAQLYRFSDELRSLHPGNSHIHDKIRQQLQILRDRGYLEFAGRGTYRRT